MMRYFITGYIISLITVASQAEKFRVSLQQEFPKTDEAEILKASESRYRDPDGNFRNYNNRITRREFDLPVTFKAPQYEANDYWRKEHYDNRRTFFDDYSYKTTAFPRFYQFMTSIFGGRDETAPDHPEGYHYPRSHPTPPYSYDPPFNFRPTEPNYIPPPKPIRASVIKLETITRSPIYPSFEYETTPKYYPHPGSLLNHVLIENSKAEEPKIPPFKPLPVLPKPLPPTTLKPNYPYFNNHSLYKYYNETDYKYPESVQDQLPHFNSEEVRIPYVSEKPIPQIFNAFPTKASPQVPPSYPGDPYPPSNSRATTNILDLIDVRSINSGGRPERPERPEVEITTVKSFPGAVEKVKRPIFKYTKKLTAQLDKSSVERVVNLTVQGFSKTEKENVNPQQPVNYLKVKDLINYEMRKLENISNPKQTTNDSAKRLVNLNDELSLDAKILKDTNWDGLTVLPTSTTEETTTFRAVPTTEITPQRNKTAFWEIVDGVTTETTTEVTTTTEQNKPRTTTEFPWTSTVEITTDSTTTEGSKIPEEAHRRLENITQLTTETPEVETTTQSERGIRRYSRRPKVVNFTPYPTAEEIQKKLINRNNFPKRQKPNITLAFGNKNVLKNRNNFVKDEVIKFSDEEVRMRRKIGKRRQVLKRVRVVTSERPFQNQ